MKRGICVLLSVCMSIAVFSFAGGCNSADSSVDENLSQKRVTDKEILDGLNAYRAGKFGWYRFYPAMLGEFAENFSSETKRVYDYCAEEGLSEYLYCGYLEKEAYESVKLPEETDAIEYRVSAAYIDGKHIGYYAAAGEDAAEKTEWLKIGGEEEIPETYREGGKTYFLDLVLAEKTYTYLYDGTADEAMNKNVACYIRLPVTKKNGKFVEAEGESQSWGNGYYQDARFRAQAGEFLTAVFRPVGNCGALNELADDVQLYEVFTINEEKYMRFHPLDNWDEAYKDGEFFLKYREELSSALYVDDGKPYFSVDKMIALFSRKVTAE